MKPGAVLNMRDRALTPERRAGRLNHARVGSALYWIKSTSRALRRAVTSSKSMYAFGRFGRFLTSRAGSSTAAREPRLLCAALVTTY
jgi:hypothetical protein